MNALTKEQLKALLDNKEDFVLINVLPEQYFQKGHIPRSVNAPVSDESFLENVSMLVDSKDKKVVVYCANFECQASPSAANKLEEAGYTDVYDYEGGVKDWEEAGLPLHKA